MSDPVFFKASRSLSLAEIAALCGVGDPSPGKAAHLVAVSIDGAGPLEYAGPHDITFFEHRKFAPQLAKTHAGVCLVPLAFTGDMPTHCVPLRVAAPYRAFVTVLNALYPDAVRPSSLRSAAGIDARAAVDPSARLESGVTIDPGAVIGPDVEIGAGTVIGATAVIGPGVRIGRDCMIGPGVSVLHALIGDRVILHAGCRIGQDGFGYIMGATHLKVPQVGRVLIQDGVEIGAGTTVDRGGIRDTVIGEGSKIDNLVQIGHNNAIGRHCVIAGQCGLSGSVTLGDYVALGGKVGIADHVTVGEGTQLAASTVAHTDIPPGVKWGGTPAKPMKLWFRELKLLEKMAQASQSAPKQGSSGVDDE